MPIIRPRRNYITEKTSNDNNEVPKKISKKIDLLDKKMDGLYRDIYITRPDNKQNLDNIINNIDSSIDKLQNDGMNVSNMSELLRRISDKKSNDTDKLTQNVMDIFNDQNLLNSLYETESIHKYISAQNYQYDMICKYLPKLLDALEIKKDNVLCSDNFSKDFINPKSVKSSKMDADIFASNVKRLERDYDFSSFIEKTYMNVSKYGEDFIYIVPYREAFERLLSNSNYTANNARLGQCSFYESAPGGNSYIKETECCVVENFTETQDYKEFVDSMKGIIDTNNLDSKFKGSKVNLHFNDTNTILESVNEMCILEEKASLEKFKSLSSIHESTVSNIESLYEAKSTNDLDKIFKSVDAITNKLSANSSDGLIIASNLEKDPSKLDKNIHGAVLERLPRENVIPVYIGKRALGYIYLEYKEESNACGFCGGNHSTPGISNSSKYAYETSEEQQDLVIRYIASKISNKIDAHFINANKDLKEDIYTVLRYNEKFNINRSSNIAVTFIPAEDIIHCYFDLDENTHRGISDLQKSVVPALLYILLYLTDIIGKITRSTDKRIYYVKQNVESNVARTMMNVVGQIKKGNMGMRQIESMNNILNVVGKYNDFIIPLGQSGDAPIQFEVMSGQDIQTPTDIMEKMEEAAVNAIMPYEMVNATMQQDFAVRFTMANTRFLKSIYTRQRLTQKFSSLIYTKIYNFEFDENNSLIEIILPPPTYLTMTNNQQLIDNITQLADKIIDIDMVDDPDEVKTEFKRLFIRSHLSTYIDYESVERLKLTAKVNIESKKEPAVDETGEDDMSEY